MIEITSMDEHEEFVRDNPIALVQYSTTWCGPCAALKPHVEKVSTQVEFPVGIVYVDTAEAGADLASEQEVSFVPVLKLHTPTGPVVINGRNVMAILSEIKQATGA